MAHQKRHQFVATCFKKYYYIPLMEFWNTMFFTSIK